MDTIANLISHGVKPSVQRVAILKYLESHKTHPAIETIYDDMKETMPTLSKTTIYNTLKLLVEKGVVLSLNIDEHGARYDGDIRKHLHFQCKKCGKVYDFWTEQVPHSTDVFIKELDGFKIEETQINYKGICKNCL